MSDRPELTDRELTDLVEEIASRGASVRLRVHGGSMLPSLRAGDVVLIDPVSPGELRRGLVVAARVHGRLLIHRILKVDRNGSEITVFLRGDNRVEADPPVSAAEVVGKIDRLERDGRQLCLPIRPLILTSTLRRWVRRSRQQLAMRRWFRTH